MEKVSKIQIGCSKYDIQDKEARELIQLLRDDILDGINVNATVDSNTGTPNVFVDKSENSFTLNFTGLKGETGPRGEKGERGDRGEQGFDGNDGRDGRDGKDGADGRNGITPHLRATASVGNTIGVPNVQVSVSGTDEEPVFNFLFDGIRGKDGTDGTDGRDGRNGVDGRDGRDGGIATITNDIIENIKDKVIQNITQLDSEVEQKVESLLSDADWIQEHFFEGIVGVQTSTIEGYLRRVGLWFDSDDATYTKWTTVRQTYDTIRNEVAQLKASQGTGGTIDYEALAGSLYTYITGDTVTSGVESTWARFLNLDAEMLEWMTAGMRSQANSQQAVSSLFAAAAEHDETRNIANAALAGVNAIVTKDSNGNYVAKSEFISSVSSQINGGSGSTSTAGLATEAYVDSAVASLFADNGAGRAYVTTYVNNAISNITISADQINLDGTTWADVLKLAFSPNNIFDNSYHTIIDGEGLTISTSGNKLGGGTNISASGMRSYFTSTFGTLECSIGHGGLWLSGLSYIALPGGHGNLVVNDTIQAGKFSSTRYESTGALTVFADGTLSLRGSDISIGDSNTETITISVPITLGSDEALKDIVDNINLPVENIAATRTVNYKFKSNPNKIYSGVIAQDWESILPNTVKAVDEEQHLGLDYSSAALISAVVDAREIVALKHENDQLKQRLAAIEERLGI